MRVAHRNLGNAWKKRGDLVRALEHYRKALDIAEQRATQDSKDSDAQQALIEALTNVAETQEERGEAGQAAAAFGRALERAEALLARDPSQPSWVQATSKLRKKVATCCKKHRARR